jgi:hypothetical protein
MTKPTTPTEVTARQNVYLKELAEGPLTTRELVLSLMVSQKSVGKMMKILREKGLVQTRLLPHSQRSHSLIAPYDELQLTLIFRKHTPNNADPSRISREMYELAELSDRGLVGQGLHQEHIKTYPHREYRAMRRLKDVARGRGLCR